MVTKRSRPSRHFRVIKTSKGKRKILINKGVKKKQKHKKAKLTVDYIKAYPRESGYEFDIGYQGAKKRRRMVPYGKKSKFSRLFPKKRSGYVKLYASAKGLDMGEEEE